MIFNTHSVSLGKFVAASVLAATLAACGGGSQDDASSASSSGVSTSTGASRTTGANVTTQEVVALSEATYSTTPASTVEVRVDRHGPTNGAATVGYSTVNGTAYAGVDYQATTGSVSWEDGDTSAKIISVPVMGHANGKTFSISLISVDGDAQFGSPASATIEVVSSGTSSSSSSGSSSSGGGSTSSSSSGSAPTSGTSSSSSSSGGSSSTSSSSGVSSGGGSSSSGSAPSGSSSGSSSGGSSSGGSSSSSSSSGGSSSSSGSTPIASTGTASLSWTAPTENTNGSALTNLAGYTIYYGTSASAMATKVSITTVGLVDYNVSNLAHGTWYFAINAVNSAGEESALSGTVSVTL